MKKPSLIITGLGVALALFVGTTFYFQNTNSTSPSHSAASDTLTQGSSAMWISSAESVDEVTKEANLIVRARVVKSPESRVLRETLPRVEVSNGKSIVVGEEVSESVFSDTMFEVVQTYVGKSTSEIMVVQTGGPNPNNPNNIMQMVDDPLYQVGEEYILFLVDISGDSIQAPDRTLYRVVNPSGRYQISDGAVEAYGEKSDAASRQPRTLVDLEAQIMSATK